MNIINQKLKVMLGGLSQKIHIRSNDDTLPVLLFLHGGPGVINRHGVMTAHLDLLDSFTLAAWDQRGSGGSFWGCKRDTLTIERVTDDAAELIEWLCRRFHKDKIFIIGGSWGSQLGTHLAFRHPAKIAAYVGFGQVVNGTLNETLSYRFALNAAKAAGDLQSVKKLETLGEPEGGIYKGGFKGMMTQRRVMMKHGGYSSNKKKRSYFRATVLPILFSGEYSLGDIIGVVIGYKIVLETMWDEIAGTDLAAECRFAMPYFIFDGRQDNNTPASLVEDYFKAIEAPRKELVWFDQAGHNPMSDEPERFKTLLREKLGEVAQAEKAGGIRI